MAALARKRLWLTDAYYAGSTADVQALKSAARDGVDGAGYGTLLEAGVRVFECNGPMLHAKTAVADGRWSRVGSTDLNIGAGSATTSSTSSPKMDNLPVKLSISRDDIRRTVLSRRRL